jgi:hypothetical protein
LRPARGARPLDPRVQLIVCVALAVAGLAWSDAQAKTKRPLLAEQAWLAPGVDPARDLTHTPRECLSRTSPQIEVGRAAFSLPTVLGGPAARAGLSCAACHAAGRTNARFFLPELTDSAGAADVTSEWASRVRGNGRLDPIPIPDLAGAATRPVYGAARILGLSEFIRGVVVEEFQGRDDPATIGALAAYVEALGSDCGDGEEKRTLDAAVADVDRTVRAAQDLGDPRMIGLALRAARGLIGRLVERVPERGRLSRERGELARLAGDLAALEDAAGSVSPNVVKAAAPGWRARFAAATAPMRARPRATYFDEASLRRALKQRP